MKAVVVNKSGLAEALELTSLPKPVIMPDQLLVRVHAASVNQIDWKRASGQMGAAMTPSFPWVPGYDFAGVVEEVGNEAVGFEVGDKVYGCCDGGAYAEYVAADADKVAPKPKELSYDESTGVAFVAITAVQALFRHGKLSKGQHVLIHGAAGSVGAFAVQLARWQGAVVYTTASGRDADFVKSLGAKVVIDYKTQDFAMVAKNIDLVVDLVGGEVQRKSYGVLKKGGRLIELVDIIDEELAAKAEVKAIRMGVSPSSEGLRTISRRFNGGELRCDIAAVYPLEQAAEAWNYVLGDSPDKKHGKVVLHIG